MVKLTERLKANLTALIKKRGIDEQTIDLTALWDSTLTYQENKRKIEEHIGKNFQFEISEKQAKDESDEFEREFHELEEKRAKIQLEKEIREIKTKKSSLLNEYFRPLKNYVITLIKAKSIYGLICEGDAGLGKSYTTFQTLEEMGLKNGIDYIVISNYSTPLELYELLYKYNDKIIVFDDIIKIFEDDISVMLLQSAMWHRIKKMRILNYFSTTGKLNAPNTFEFKGKIIILTNNLPEQLTTIKSRCFYLPLEFRWEDRIKMIYEICKINKIPMEIAEFIRRNSTPAFSINLRIPFKLAELYSEYQKNGWEGLALKQLEAKSEKQKLWEILQDNSVLTIENKANKFRELTGLSRATFFRYKAEIERGL